MSKYKYDNATVNSEIYDIARGLYDSKVNIKRPPSAAQRSVYTTSFRGPPPAPAQVNAKEKKPRPYSAKARITSDKSDGVRKPRLPWRPFSGTGHAALKHTTSFLADYTVVNKEAKNVNEKQEQEILCDLTVVPTAYQDRSLPKSLLGLTEWLSESIPDDWLSCYSPQHSFVFLPCLGRGECDNLPGVPPVQQPEDLLVYNPAPQVRKYKPPKPRFRHFVDDEEREKKHNNYGHKGPRFCQISSFGRGMIHDVNYEGKRTTDIIRQEIEDLERLLQGTGNPAASSVVVRYQHDINHLRNMLQTTLNGYEFAEDTQQCLTSVAAYFQEDLVRYPEQHEQIFKTIKQQRDQCVQELANIEHEIMKKSTCS